MTTITKISSQGCNHCTYRHHLIIFTTRKVSFLLPEWVAARRYRRAATPTTETGGLHPRARLLLSWFLRKIQYNTSTRRNCIELIMTERIDSRTTLIRNTIKYYAVGIISKVYTRIYT